MRIGVMLPSLIPLQLPSRMETHLWYILPNEVKSESLLQHYSELLSPSEKEKLLRMRSDELNKKNVLLARTLVRTTIARYQTNDNTAVVDPRSLKFKKNLYGKPEVEDSESDNPKLQFNISHTDSLIACGVTVNVPVGIDVEDKRRKMRHDVLALARRFYSSEEVSFLSAIADAEAQREEFIKMWTLKEAYVKALGKGFSASPFNTFTIIQAEAGAKESYHLCEAGERIGEWKFMLLELAASSHYAAICVEDEDDDANGVEAPMNVIVHRTIPFVEDELISDWKLL